VLYECLNDNLGLLIYLLKHFTRVAAGLSYVELLILWGALRSGKDTFISTLAGKCGLMGLNNNEADPGFSCAGPNHYFCARPQNARQGQESHSANTASFNGMRVVVLPDIPNERWEINKEKLDGQNPVHARHGHSTSEQSQQVFMKHLWLAHGNRRPPLQTPDDLAQADRVAVIHVPTQFGPLDNPDWAFWDPRVDVAMRRQENPLIKVAADHGTYCTEAFEHTKHCRMIMTPGRRIEPRPACVKAEPWQTYFFKNIQNIQNVKNV